MTKPIMKNRSILSRILLILISTFTLSGWSQSLIILGDSLSASYNIPLESGWVHLLESRLNKDYPDIKVLNTSISGEVTGNALKRLPAILEQNKPAVVVIELGGNDGLRGFPLKQVKANLENMIKLSQAAGAKVVLTGIHLPPNYGPAYTQIFSNAYQQLATQYKTEFVPFILQDVGDNPELMQADGIHPTAEAQPIVLKNMWPAIEKAINKISE
ncbi:arylesterase [Pleionea sp. CnH1-48]|uniref:arylesterase n=1 Tax=Pleionea sp. CnH1-48 TaxID=2954494 RepID=UPI0020981C5B|nr:arylesterase [Pleionea sp. CnH1-48]MCO7225403.1 arylesterase [Pleionea sp. CnH1-48]